MPLTLTAPVTQEDLVNYLNATTSATREICEGVAACFFYENEDGEQVFSGARRFAITEVVDAAYVALALAEEDA